ALDRLARILPAPRPELRRGADGLVTLTRDVDADVVASALVGGAGPLPPLGAGRAGRTVALASHEKLGMGGGLVSAGARGRRPTVHSMVEYVDGAVIAQLGVADMAVPILYALSYPGRRPSSAARLDLTRVGQLTFYEPDTDKFPCLGLARGALAQGGVAPVV